jgi:parallel beta-helix repeat protein
MAIKYCDFINGNDTTGDGTAGLPYKTITKASTGLTGGDEVRVAKSPAPTALTGTLAFTQNSTAVVGTDTLFTTELVIGDFVKGGDDNWWEVITITDNTNATLYRPYSGVNANGVSSQKLGITSTGVAAASTTQVQVVSASGSSAASMLKVSGGWTLAGEPTQDGQTYFRNMHTTFANRYGYGLYLDGKSFVEIERLHFLRYYYGIYLYNYSHNNIITSPTCNSNYQAGIHLYFASDSNTLISPTCIGNYYYGIHLYIVSNITITSPTCKSHYDYGIYIIYCHNNIITFPTCTHNQYGIIFVQTSNCVITSANCGNNSSTGIILNFSSNNIINEYEGTLLVEPNKSYGDYPGAECQHFATAGDNRCYYEFGITYRDTANARSGECLKYDPTSAIYYISQSFFFRTDSGVAQTLSAYIKKEAAFNGDVQGAIYFMGEKITGWTTITPTANDTYEKKELVAAAGDITEDGVLELRIKVRGSAGNVYVDDLATT